jgi:hypothetical protein
MYNSIYTIRIVILDRFLKISLLTVKIRKVTKYDAIRSHDFSWNRKKYMSRVIILLYFLPKIHFQQIKNQFFYLYKNNLRYNLII